MRLQIFLISILALLLFSCKKDRGKISCEQNPNAQTLSHDKETREYILYVPSSYDGTKNVPLMLNFHGYGGNANDHMTYADMRSLADSENFILVYPQGSCLEGVSHWNPSLPSPDNKSDVDDLGFIDALITELSTNYKIDADRIYACGYSNGSMFAHGLACYKSNLIAAIGSVSGTMLDIDCTPSHPIAVINIHGTSDGVLPYNGSNDYNSVETVLNFWINFNKTNTTPVLNSVDDNGTTIEHYLYNQGNNDVSVEHYKIIGGDHVWFDIDYQGANTNELIWNFVSKYDINGLR
ncbi:MAG: hypothetical protein GY810_17180 [Aureispira sp.]|nr:hypothetical protein [Aureispira sp.]